MMMTAHRKANSRVWLDKMKDIIVDTVINTNENLGIQLQK